MAVDIQIDKLTDCLVERETGNVVDTEYTERISEIKKKEFLNGDSIGVKHKRTAIQSMSYL